MNKNNFFDFSEDHGKNPDIQVLRGFAVLFVIFLHIPELYIFPSLKLGSWAGVDLFFVISGFVVSNSFLSLLNKKPPIRALISFYIKRIYRIFPQSAFWLFFSIVLSATFNRNNSFGETQLLLNEAKAILLLYYNYFVVHYYHPIYLAQYWSLMVEEQFYLIIPSFLMLFKRATTVVVLISMAIVALYIYNTFYVKSAVEMFPQFKSNDSILNLYYERFLIFVTHRRIDGLLAGVALSFIPNFKALAFNKNISFYLVLASLTLIWLFSSIYGDYTVHSYSFYLIWIPAFIALLIIKNNTNVFGSIKYFPTNFFLYVGSRSYVLYLCHMPAKNLYNETEFYLNQELDLNFINYKFLKVYFIYFLMFIFAEVTYNLIEKRFNKMGRKLASKI